MHKYQLHFDLPLATAYNNVWMGKLKLVLVFQLESETMKSSLENKHYP